MKLLHMLFLAAIALLVVPTAALAGDYAWTRDFNVQAQADPSGFRARIAARFKLGDMQVKTVLSNFESPADAYMVLRLGEMSGRPTGYVVEKYRSGQGKGWGALANSLGIKPGSREFHALKSGHDLRNSDDRGQILYSSYDPGKDKGKGKGKGKKNR